jgi:hypothetical protein
LSKVMGVWSVGGEVSSPQKFVRFTLRSWDRASIAALLMRHRHSLSPSLQLKRRTSRSIHGIQAIMKLGLLPTLVQPPAIHLTCASP